MQHWLVKEYAKLVGNHLQIWSGSFTGRGGGGLGLLKLQLQVLKKRRVLTNKDYGTKSPCTESNGCPLFSSTQYGIKLSKVLQDRYDNDEAAPRTNA